MSIRRFLVAAVVPVALLTLAGCTPAAGADPRAWLEAVCPADASYESDFDPDFGFDDLARLDQLRCTWTDEDGEEQAISAYLLREDPSDELTGIGDAYQSGDGISPDAVFREVDGGWAVVFTYDSGRELDALMLQGFHS